MVKISIAFKVLIAQSKVEVTKATTSNAVLFKEHLFIQMHCFIKADHSKV